MEDVEEPTNVSGCNWQPVFLWRLIRDIPPTWLSKSSSSWKLRDVAALLFRASLYRHTWYSIHRMIQLSPPGTWPRSYHGRVQGLALRHMWSITLLKLSSAKWLAAKGGAILAWIGFSISRLFLSCALKARTDSSWVRFSKDLMILWEVVPSWPKKVPDAEGCLFANSNASWDLLWTRSWLQEWMPSIFGTRIFTVQVFGKEVVESTNQVWDLKSRQLWRRWSVAFGSPRARNVFICASLLRYPSTWTRYYNSCFSSKLTWRLGG